MLEKVSMTPIGIVHGPVNEVVDDVFGGVVSRTEPADAHFAATPESVYSRQPIAMLGGRTSEQWIAQYASSHRHPVNRMCHTFGIPAIVVSLALFAGALFYHPSWKWALGLFLFGWALQFIGHAFEGKEPEFFHDWRFLFVGVRWWVAKMRGRA